MPRTLLSLAFLCILAALLSACAELRTTGQVLATPLTVVRDVVDAPLVSVANLGAAGARRTRPDYMPHAGVGITTHGPALGLGFDISYFLFQGLSYGFGAVDYVLARSLYPNFPNGISPWKPPKAPWSTLYFPNTRALWNVPVEDLGNAPPERK